MSKENNLLVEAAEVLDNLLSWADLMGGFDATIWRRAAELKEKLDRVLSSQKGEWITWQGGEMPVPPKTLIHVRYRNGVERHGIEAGGVFANAWGHINSPWDIVSYQVVE